MLAEANDVKPRVRVPGANRFKDEQGLPVDYLRADDLAGLALHLIRTKPSLDHLTGARIEYLWKRKASRSRGKAQLGHCQKASGLVGYYSESDFVIYLAADTSLVLTADQIEAALFHQLCHISLRPSDPEDDDDEDELVLVSHDVEAFAAEVQEYGLWSPDLKEYESQTRQLKLFGSAETDAKGEVGGHKAARGAVPAREFKAEVGAYLAENGFEAVSEPAP